VGGINEAFKMVYDFYVKPDETVLDMCCGKKLMYRGYDYPNVEFNDVVPELEADYHYDCREISKHIDKTYNWAVYDPPYVDIKGRDDERDDDYKYDMVGDLDDFREFTLLSKAEILNLLEPGGGVIAKITDFHWDGELHGHHDLIEWFRPEFYIWDLRIYRFFRRGFNINWYTRKCFKTHSYFLVFKSKT